MRGLGRFLDAAIFARRRQIGEGNLMVERKDGGERKMRNAVFSEKKKGKKYEKQKRSREKKKKRRRGEG